jgi:HPt (histidine-containing phosphotransfer) domain-containing protein
LGDFYKLIDLKADKIEKCLADGLIREVTIEVHALKSTARMIGAKALSADFARLEQYGNAENIEALERETPAVLEQYRLFKPLLKQFGGAAEEEKRAASSEELTALLNQLKTALDGFDLDGADEALKQLDGLQIPEKCHSNMEKLRAYVADVDASAAVKTAETMIALI